ncbi:bifunctional [glutamine synthetase] adenylyltransferase/[glutamine synthetase]-adenylyl-L-tyrosine phosphorylase [Corynebacterium pseudopelargi]|uniref:Bifunctional glutamine synthetase adenylyltransferase/adenylyl-removing enzyme n=1 Tax=Corynebacterium pseudopelargi TaxID=2080757 RepID=A0A3G6IXK0_9CORY|nr:bifunctional [glutamine synthetase] adenylyltransferase/[glutamine synthetase]-adenylyl-L-tyrosine phosphorylase [Corynebacterium pseudopelargi]AZA08860.1 Glutamate-ammonia-ligase adenylyltransferase [Corynebacterium pseudopelargi]
MSQQPTNTRKPVRGPLPSVSALGFHGQHAAKDLEWLGWWNEASLPLLWALAGTANEDLALNSLIRFMEALEPKEREEVDLAIRGNLVFRVRLFALLGGSSVLGDHLVAHPHLWRELDKPMPNRAGMFVELLSSVEAKPAQFQPTPPEDAELSIGMEFATEDPAIEECSTAGTYCAGIGGQEAEVLLRRTYRNLLLRIAAVDLAGTYLEDPRREGQPEVDFSVVTSTLADLADAALTAALAVAVRNTYGDEPLDTHLAVLAMGKCGARELNYISDVDVIFVAEPPSPAATKLAGEFIRIGCRSFFEVDAALRPEGKRGALVRTLDSHVAYYKRWADTWEFQALLKHRPMTGYIPLAQQYSDAISPLVWNASQRDSFVDDVQSMRRRVLENVPAALKSRELKLGEGGLRDVEFAVQLLQLVHGRTDESLRTLATVDALAALVEGGYIGREDGAELTRAYEFLRLLEHRLQLHKVKRTHTLPAPQDQKNLRWLARSAGFRSSKQGSAIDAMDEQLRKVRLHIQNLHRKLFYRPLLNSVAVMDADTIKLSPEAAKLQLGALGYKFPDRAFEHLQKLAAGSSRKAKIQSMLLPTLMEWLSQTADPDAGLLNYRKLSETLNDQTWFLRMLRDEGIVGQRLMRILGNSPYASDLILSTPNVIKQFGDGASGPKLLDTKIGTVSKSLVAAAGRHDNPKKAIAVARSLRRKELARIASADLLNMMEVEEVCRALSFVWDAVLEAALGAEIRASVAEEELDSPPARIAVIGMGRLGGAELGYGSDADVMFVCEPVEGVEENQAVKWAISVCDRMRQRLAKPSGDPPLEVDLGLRPEGRSGAVVRTLESYERYYERWGEVWEIQALLRATGIAGDMDLAERFLHMIDRFRYPDAGVTQKVIREVRRMKARVDNERLPRGADPKTHTKLGRGALTDIEWTVQLLTLMHAHTVPALRNTSTLASLDVIAQQQLLEKEKVETLKEAWLAATEARNAIVLVRGKRVDQLPQPGPQLAAVAGAAGWNPEDYQEFLEHYLRLTRRARQVVDEVFWGEAMPTEDER